MSRRLLLEGGDLPVLMARVRDEYGPSARVVRAERVRSGGVAGFFAREHYELTIEVAVASGIDALVDAVDEHELALADAVAPDAPVEPLVSTAGAAFADVLGQVRALAGATAIGAVPSAAVPSAEAPAPFVPLRLAPLPTSVPRPAPEPEPVDARDAPADEPAETSDLADRLRALGVPERLLAGTPTLAGVLAGIVPAAAARRGPGDSVTLVGPAGAVERFAAVLAARWELDDAWVLRVGTTGKGAHRLADVDAVDRWRVRAGSAAHSWLLVVPVGPDPSDREYAARLVEAARPATVWALVDARTRASDARRWLTDVGSLRALDALAVDGVLDASEPGSVLDLGLPVAFVDGVPASRVAWAAALGQDVDAALR